MFDMQGQPPEIVIRLVQYISVLPIAELTDKQKLHPDVLYFIGLYNICSSLLVLYVFYHILLKLKFSIELSLAGVIVLGTLFNFNLYTRHILPYDHALLFQLLAFNLLLRDEARHRTILLAGLLSAIGLTNYYGSFMFTFINGGYLIVRYYSIPLVAIKKCLLFILPFFAVVVTYEFLTRFSGSGSYLNFLSQYSKTVNMASFDEGLNYIFKYFYQVEKLWGVLVLLLFFVGTYLAFIRSESARVKQVLFLGITAYLSYGIYVYISHKMVFHGRVLHIFYPFVVVGVLSFLQQQRLFSINHVIVGLIILSIINYGFVIKDFNRIGYPRNSIYKYHLFEKHNKVNFTYYEEMASPVHYSSRSEWCIDSLCHVLLPVGYYKACNLCFNFHFPDSAIKSLSLLHIASTDSIVFEQLHFQSHPAYVFEYCTRFGRNYFIEKQLKIRIIKMNSFRVTSEKVDRKCCNVALS